MSASITIAKTQWGLVWVAFIAGLCAASHIGKVPPALPLLVEDLSLSLVGASTIVSSFSFIAAAFALPIALLAARLGAVRAGLFGLLAIAVGSLSGAWLDSYASLLATRVIEGLGMVTIAVAMPSLIGAICTERDRSLAMGLWAAFVPAGVATMLLISPLLLGSGWHALWLTAGGGSLLWLAVFSLCFSRSPPPRSQSDLPSANWKAALTRGPLCLSASFCAYAAMFNALFAFLPTMMIDLQKTALADAANIAALAVSGNIVGNVIGGLLHGLGFSSKRLLIVGLAGGGLCAAPLFMFTLTTPMVLVVAFSYALVAGVLPAVAFATAPKFVRRPTEIILVIGLIFHGAGAGQLLGPLILGALVDYSGSWTAGLVFIALMTISGVIAASRLPVGASDSKTAFSNRSAQ